MENFNSELISFLAFYEFKSVFQGFYSAVGQSLLLDCSFLVSCIIGKSFWHAVLHLAFGRAWIALIPSFLGRNDSSSLVSFAERVSFLNSSLHSWSGDPDEILLCQPVLFITLWSCPLPELECFLLSLIPLALERVVQEFFHVASDGFFRPWTSLKRRLVFSQGRDRSVSLTVQLNFSDLQFCSRDVRDGTYKS